MSDPVDTPNARHSRSCHPCPCCCRPPAAPVSEETAPDQEKLMRVIVDQQKDLEALEAKAKELESLEEQSLLNRKRRSLR